MKYKNLKYKKIKQCNIVSEHIEANCCNKKFVICMLFGIIKRKLKTVTNIFWHKNFFKDL